LKLLYRAATAGSGFFNKMTDFKKIAGALDPPIPATEVEKLLPVMDALEAAFRPLQQSLTPEDDVWTGVE
jgi:hypothetical protein